MRWFVLSALVVGLLFTGCSQQANRKPDQQAKKQPAAKSDLQKSEEDVEPDGDEPRRNSEDGVFLSAGDAGVQNDFAIDMESAASGDFADRVGGFGGGALGVSAKPAEGPQQAAAVGTWKRSKVIPNTSRLMVGDKEELPLHGMQVDVRIDGFRARVLLDCYYYNDREDQLEGTFQLRLPNGASPYYLAFGQTRYTTPDLEPHQPEFFTSTQLDQVGTSPEDILALRSDTWREPQSARVVPKEKAAFSYSETVRQRVDPALMEWSGAGVFRTRVFPLEPQKLHRIVIGYDVNLLPVGDDLVYELNLPESLKNFVVDLNVPLPEGTEVVVTPETPVHGRKGRYRFEDSKAHTIKARITRPGTLLLQGLAPQLGSLFSTQFSPTIPLEKGVGGSSQGVFLVDVSLSANPDQFNVWLKMLQTILENNRSSLKQFAVVFFNVESFWWKDAYVANTAENVDELLAFANTLSLEGATDLGNLFTHLSEAPWLRPKGTAAADLFLLSDSAVTWGEYDTYALSTMLKKDTLGPLFAYRTGMTGTDLRMLQHLTRETGGAIFSVVGESELKQASQAHRQRSWEIVKVEVPGGEDLLLAGRPRFIFPGQRLQLVGRGEPKQPAEVRLTLKNGDQVIKLTTPIDAVIDSSLASRSYGQVAVGQLEGLKAATEPIALAYARNFRVAEQTCSLLMLETEEDYQRFNIKPEEDAFVVKRNLASSVVANALDQLTAGLGDPKTSFLSWVKRFDEHPEEGFRFSEAFKMSLNDMPRESFAVASSSLSCRGRTRAGIPEKIQEQLADKKPIYDEITAEAVRRLDTLGPNDALRVLSSLVENRPGDVVLARDVAYSAMEWGLRGQAYFLFRRVLDARPHEAQTYHAIARCLEDMERGDLALAYYEVAISGNWEGRFGEFSKIVAWDYLRFLRRLASGEIECSVKEFAAARLRTLGNQYQVKKCDLVVTIAWNTDRTDADLHVIEPTGEECYYEHRRTKMGGALTQDVTTGYGPEMYTLPSAKPGTYRVRVNYFADDVSRATTRTKVYATIYQKWGSPQEEVIRKVVSLTTGKEMHDIAIIKIPEQ